MRGDHGPIQDALAPLMSPRSILPFAVANAVREAGTAWICYGDLTEFYYFNILLRAFKEDVCHFFSRSSAWCCFSDDFLFKCFFFLVCVFFESLLGMICYFFVGA